VEEGKKRGEREKKENHVNCKREGEGGELLEAKNERVGGRDHL